MNVVDSSPSDLTDDSQHQFQNEDTPSGFTNYQTTDTGDKAIKSEEDHRRNHKKRRHSKRHKEKRSRRNVSQPGQVGVNEDKIREETKAVKTDQTKQQELKEPTNEASVDREESRTDATGDEARKAVSWKEDIETSQEFQASVLEQNVLVNLEVPDEEYEKKADRELESYTWDSVTCGPNISVIEKRPYIARRLIAKQSTDGARGSQGFSKGRHTFRFKFNDKPWGSNCSIGVCTANTILYKKGYCHLFGEDSETWAWDIPSGSLRHNGEVTQYYISAIDEKLIYMTVDFNKGHLYFQPKDRDRFLAFKGLSADKELFPCVSMVYGLAEVKLGLKHSTDNSFKLLKQERESKESKVKQDTKNLDQDSQTEDRSDLNVSDTSQKSNEEDLSNMKADMNQSTDLPQPEVVTTPAKEDADLFADKDRIHEEASEHESGSALEAKYESEDQDENVVLSQNRRTSVKTSEDEDGIVKTTSQSSVSPEPRDPKEDADDQVTSVMTRGQPDGQRGDLESDRLYKKSSSLSWADAWQDNDLYIVESGSILRESIKDKDLSDLTQSGDPTNSAAVKTYVYPENCSSPPPPAVYTPPNRVSVNPDIEEPEDAQYTQIASLEDYRQYGIHMSHGWDVTNRGGTIHLYPNIPYLCVPMPSFSDKVQGIRGRQGFKEGIHRWKITEMKSFSPNVPLDEMHITANKLHIGVVSEDQRTFNFGYNLTAVGPHMWTYEVETGLIWHGQSKITDLTLTAGSGASSENFPSVDVTKGIEVEINFYKHLLVLRYQDKVIAQIKNIRAKQLFPFLLFNKKAVFPMEIQYLEGPEGYVTESLTKLEKMESLDKEDLVNYRGLTRQMSSKTNIVVVENELLKTYDWGKVSRGLKIKGLSGGNVIQLPKGSFQLRKHFVALTEKPIFGQRHKIDFTTKHIESCIFGLASDHLDKSLFDKEGGLDNTEVTVSILGDNVHSWAWDPKTLSLYHGSRYLGRYPSRAIDFQHERYDRLRLMVDFSSTGYNIASFTAMSTERRQSLDLGIAFVNLPSSVYPAVAVITGGDKDNVQVAVDYVSGPKGFVTEIVQAKTCSIL